MDSPDSTRTARPWRRWLTRRPAVFALTALVLAGAVAAAIQLTPSNAADSAAQTPPPGTAWRCAPCGCAHDHVIFKAPGNCPSCGMPLVDASTLPPLASPDSLHDRVAVLLFDGVQMIDWSGPFEVFSGAHMAVVTASRDGRPVTASGGARLTPTHALADVPPVDVLVVPGGDGVEAVLGDSAVIDWVRARAGMTGIVLSVCTGALVLAKADLLQEGTATTFYDALEDLRAMAPRTRVVNDQRWVDEGKIVTTAGLSSGIDGALHVVARLYGAARAQQTALNMEYEWSEDAEWARASLADAPLRRQLGRSLELPLPGLHRARLIETRGDDHGWLARWTATDLDAPAEALTQLHEELREIGWERLDTKSTAGSTSTTWRSRDAERSPWWAMTWARSVGPTAAPEIEVGARLLRATLTRGSAGGMGQPASAAVGSAFTARGDEVLPQIGANRRVWAAPGGRPVVEPHLAAHPTDPSRLLGAAMLITDPERPFESARLVSFASRDAGATWTAAEFDAWGYDPWAVFLPSGGAVVSWLGTPGRFTEETPIRLLRSADGGAHWDTAVEIVPGAFDGSKLTVDPASGDLVVTAASFEPGPMSIYFDRAKAGRKFASPRHVGQGGSHVAIGESAVLADGTVTLLGVGGPGAAGIRRNRLWVHRSTDGGKTFSEPIVVSRRTGRGLGYTHLVADTGKGWFANRLYVVQAAGTAGEPGGIWLNRSSDGGLSWSRDVRIDRGQEHMLAMLPSIAITRDGVVGVSWIGRTRDASGAWGESRLFFAASFDGGNRFTPAVEVTEVGSHPLTKANAHTGTELPAGGHYMGLAARADGVFQLLWSDSRNGVFEVFTATAAVNPRRSLSMK